MTDTLRDETMRRLAHVLWRTRDNRLNRLMDVAEEYGNAYAAQALAAVPHNSWCSSIEHAECCGRSSKDCDCERSRLRDMAAEAEHRSRELSSRDHDPDDPVFGMTTDHNTLRVQIEGVLAAHGIDEPVVGDLMSVVEPALAKARAEEYERAYDIGYADAWVKFTFDREHPEL